MLCHRGGVCFIQVLCIAMYFYILLCIPMYYYVFLCTAMYSYVLPCQQPWICTLLCFHVVFEILFLLLGYLPLCFITGYLSSSCSLSFDFPVITGFSILSFLIMCPRNFGCWFLLVFINFHFASKDCRTSAFDVIHALVRCLNFHVLKVELKVFLFSLF